MRFRILRRMYDMTKRERLECHPLKGTKKGLKRLAKKEGVKPAAFIAKVLQDLAGVKEKP